MKNILAIIPARGGSKGVLKNIKFKRETLFLAYIAILHLYFTSINIFVLKFLRIFL